MVNIERAGEKPIYTQLAEMLTHDILSGRIKPGKLPSERALSSEYKVAHLTLRQALGTLRSQGIIKKYPRRGSFVQQLGDTSFLGVTRQPVRLMLGSASQLESNQPADIPARLLFAGAIDGLRARGVRTEVLPQTPDSCMATGLNRLLASDSFLIVTGGFGLEFLRSLAEAQAKVIVLSPKRSIIPELKKHPFLTVSYRREDAIAKGVSYLKSKGRRRLAFLWSGDEERLALFRKIAEACGLALDAALLVRCAEGVQEGYRAMQVLREGTARFDAVFCETDHRAVGAAQLLREQGVDIPAEVAVMGYNNFEIASQSVPALTTVTVPYYEMGRKAAEMAVDSVFKPGLVELDSTLVVRESA